MQLFAVNYMTALLKLLAYLVNGALFIYFLVMIVLFIWVNYWFVPDEYNAIYHQTSVSASIMTRVILYGMGIIELLVVLAILASITYGLLKLSSTGNAGKVTKLIFAIEASVGSLLLIILALLSK